LDHLRSAAAELGARGGRARAKNLTRNDEVILPGQLPWARFSYPPLLPSGRIEIPPRVKPPRCCASMLIRKRSQRLWMSYSKSAATRISDSNQRKAFALNTVP